MPFPYLYVWLKGSIATVLFCFFFGRAPVPGVGLAVLFPDIILHRKPRLWHSNSSYRAIMTAPQATPYPTKYSHLYFVVKRKSAKNLKNKGKCFCIQSSLVYFHFYQGMCFTKKSTGPSLKDALNRKLMKPSLMANRRDLINPRQPCWMKLPL